MSDTTYNVFQHYGTAAERAAFVPDPPTATQPIYIWYETDTDDTYIYTTAWHGPFETAGGVPSLHAPTHSLGGTDPVDVTDLAGYPGGSTTFLRDDGTFNTPSTAVHAASHSDAGSDEVDVTDLGGFPGGTTTFLRADGTFAAPAGGTVRRQVTVIIDGGGAIITTGLKTFVSLPLAGTWMKWRLLSIDAAATAGSIVIDVWKDTYANYPPTIADTITASAKPTLSAVNKNEDSALTGWTTAFAAGDILGFSVDSVTTVTKVMLVLEFE